MINFPVYLYSTYISFFLYAFGLIGALYHHTPPKILTSAGSLGLAGVGIYLFVVQFRLWAFVIKQAEKSGITPSIASPGLAVGGLLIPVYQFYWLFVCLRGLTRDLNLLAQERGLAARLSMKLATVTSAFCAIGWIPYVHFVAAPILSLALLPVCIYQVTTFARNLQILEETGQDLFTAHSRARREMVAVRSYGAIFPDNRVRLSTIAMIVLLWLIWHGLVLILVSLYDFMGLSATTIVLPLVFAALLFPVSYHPGTAFFAVGCWILLSGMMGFNESIRIGMPFGNINKYLHAMFQVSFLCGVLFTASLWLGIRVWGVRWWGIVLACGVSFIVYLILSKLLFNFDLYINGMFVLHMLMIFGLMTAVLYLGIYMKLKRRIEEQS